MCTTVTEKRIPVYLGLTNVSEIINLMCVFTVSDCVSVCKYLYWPVLSFFLFCVWINEGDFSSVISSAVQVFSSTNPVCVHILLPWE